MAAPRYDDDFPTWAGPVFGLLEASVVAARAEAEMGVVCFHPAYATPDGTSFPGFGHMHSVPRLLQWLKREQQVAQKKRDDENFMAAAVAAAAAGTVADASSTTSMDLNDNDKESCPMLSRQDVAAGGAWQRRTPHATINVLRADQLARAESQRDSATLHPRNIRALMVVGNAKLSADLERERNLDVSFSSPKSKQSTSS